MITPLAKKYLASYSGLSFPCWQQIIISFLNSTAVGLIFFISIYFAKVLNFNLITVGMIMSAYGLGTALGGIISGRLSDLLPATWIFVASMLVQALTLFALPHFTQAKFVIGDMFIFGIATYGFKTANNLWVLKYSHSHPDIKLKVVNILYSASNLGVGVAAILVGLFENHYGFKDIFYFCGYLLLFASMCSIVTYIFSHRHIEKEGEVKIKTDHENANIATKPDRRIVFLMLSCLFMVSIIVAQLSTTYGIFLHDTFPSLGVKAVSILFIVNTVIIIFFQTPIVHAFRDKNKIMLVGFGSFLYGFGMFMLIFSPIFALAVFACVVRTIGEIFFYSVAQLVCYQSVSPSRRGSILGIFQTTSAISIIIGPTIGGALYSNFGATSVWYLCGLLGLICFIACSFFSKTK